MTNIRHLAAAAVTVTVLAACGGHTGTGAGTTAKATAPVPCHAQFDAWRSGPARASAKMFLAKFRALQAASNAQDVPRMVAALKDAGKAASALEAYPPPRCADPAGYWPQVLTRFRAGAGNAGTGSGLGALLLAMVPLKQVPGLLAKFSVELRHTVGVSKAFG